MEQTQVSLPLSELYPVIQEALAMGGEFTVYPGGTSMLPTICPGKDAVVLSLPNKVKRGDILLYRRESGVFVLHRVVGIRKDGSLVMRGDNQFFNESGVLPSQVIAVVARYYKGEKAIIRGSAVERRLFFRLRLRYGAKRIAGGIRHRLTPKGGKQK